MFTQLPDFLRWANRSVLHSLKTVATFPSNVVPTLAHILAAEEIWLARLKGDLPTTKVWPDNVTLDQLPAWIERSTAGYKNYISNLDSDQLTNLIQYSNSRGEGFQSRVSDILIHVIAHGSHHRGQIASVIKDLGGTPAVTDYVLFSRKITSR